MVSILIDLINPMKLWNIKITLTLPQIAGGVLSSLVVSFELMLLVVGLRVVSSSPSNLFGVTLVVLAFFCLPLELLALFICSFIHKFSYEKTWWKVTCVATVLGLIGIVVSHVYYTVKVSGYLRELEQEFSGECSEVLSVLGVAYAIKSQKCEECPEGTKRLLNILESASCKATCDETSCLGTLTTYLSELGTETRGLLISVVVFGVVKLGVFLLMCYLKLKEMPVVPQAPLQQKRFFSFYPEDITTRREYISRQESSFISQLSSN